MSSFSAMYRRDGENAPAVLQTQGKWFWRCSQALCRARSNPWSEFAVVAEGWGSSPCHRPAFVLQAEQEWPQEEWFRWGQSGGDVVVPAGEAMRGSGMVQWGSPCGGSFVRSDRASASCLALLLHWLSSLPQTHQDSMRFHPSAIWRCLVV